MSSISAISSQLLCLGVVLPSELQTNTKNTHNIEPFKKTEIKSTYTNSPLTITSIMKKIVLLLVLLCSYNAYTANAQKSSRCNVCNGSGRQQCFMCGGSGRTVSFSYFFGLQYTPCSFCCGTGGSSCMICSGTGQIVYSSTPVAVPIISTGGTSTTSHEGHSHQNNSSSSPKTCMHCYGDGKCGTCLGRGSYTSFGNTVQCPNCERNHNGVCSFCHGRGKIY